MRHEPYCFIARGYLLDTHGRGNGVSRCEYCQLSLQIQEGTSVLTFTLVFFLDTTYSDLYFSQEQKKREVCVMYLSRWLCNLLTQCLSCRLNPVTVYLFSNLQPSSANQCHCQLYILLVQQHNLTDCVRHDDLLMDRDEKKHIIYINKY